MKKLSALAAIALVAVLTSIPQPAFAKCGERHVIMFDASWCPYCRNLRAYLNSRNVKYETRDIDKVPGAKAFMRKHFGSAAVPVLLVDGEHIEGFSDRLKPEVNRLLCIR